MDEQSSPDTHKQYFLSLVTMLSMSVMQQLGKIKNPMTDKTEVHLEAAQSTIDMLDMLKAKTEGNLDADEEKLLRETLSSLKLNYFETAENKKKTKPEGSSGEDQKADKEPGAASDIKTQSPPAGEHKNPKFHKSYE